jgi:hypothetical protein
MLEAIIRRLKHDKRGISNVIVVMLSLVLIVIIVGNVVLWSYQMNQLDWERMEEDISITNAERINRSSWSVAQSEYAIGNGSHVSGSYTDTQAVDSNCERFTEALPTLTYYPNGYNVLSGSHFSGAVPSSVQTVDSDYFIANSVGTASSTLAYHPSGYNLRGSTTNVTGATSCLVSNDGVYMVFRSYPSAYSGTSAFGYSTVGGSYASIENYIRGSIFSVPNDGLAQNISAYIDLTAASQNFGDTNTESSTASIEDTIRGARFAPTYDGVATNITAYIDLESMTFGDPTAESSGSGSIVNMIRGSSFTCSESGTIQSITAYIYCTVYAKNMKAAIYDASHNFIAATEEKSVAIGTSWVTFNFPTPPSVTASNSYVLVVWSASGSGGSAYLYYYAYGSSYQGHSQSQTYGSWPSSLGSVSHNSYEYSIYCTYTPRKVKAAIYSDAHALIASTEETIVSGDGWVTFNFADPKPTLIAGAYYVLVAWSDSAGGAVYMRYSSFGSSAQGHSLSQTYGNWPVSAGFSENTYRYSIYCTYQPSGRVKAAIYSDAHTLIASTEEKTVVTTGWVTFNFASPPTLTAGTNYVLVAWSNSIGGINMHYTSGSSNQGHYLSSTYGSWPSSAGFSHNSYEYSIYCTYTPASEYTCEVEFTGTSNIESWTQLVWTIDSSFTTDGVTATFQLYNYHAGSYPASGDGYLSDTIGTTDVTETRTIITNPTYFQDASGNWIIKVKGVKTTTSRFDFKADWIEFKTTYYSQCTVSTEFTFSSMTTRVPGQLNFTIVSEYNTTNVNIIIQIWNYSSSAYITSGEGYLAYTCSGSNETKLLCINMNPQFYTSNGNAKIKITGVKSTSTQYLQKINQIMVYYKIENRLSINGVFTIDLSEYPLAYIQSIEIQLRYIANDSGERWYLQAYNWTKAAYSNVGFNSSAGQIPATGWNYYTVNFATSWRSYMWNNGTIHVQFMDQGPDSSSTIIDIDFLGVRAVIDGARFSFRNDGALTSHLVSLWIINATIHQHYDIDEFLNSGENATYTRVDVHLPTDNFIVKVITERGNVAVLASH